MSETVQRSRKKLYIIIAIVVLIAGGATVMVILRKREKPIPITTHKVFRTNITAIVTATGKIQPEVEVKIAPEVSGEIVELPVKEGQLVHRGQLLLRIKPDSYRAQVESQQAAVSSARSASVQNRAELSKADIDYKRTKKLF